MPLPSKDELVSAIEAAAFQAIGDLFSSCEERFYYCVLVTTGEGLPPVLAAWSREALDREIARDPRADPLWIKWSWADSPYLDYGSEHFEQVRRLFMLRPRLALLETPQARQAEYMLRLGAMEQAMHNLDRRGLFGRGEARNKIVINAEVTPPDHTNTETAMRLNPPEALGDWLKENAEPKP